VDINGIQTRGSPENCLKMTIVHFIVVLIKNWLLILLLQEKIRRFWLERRRNWSIKIIFHIRWPSWIDFVCFNFAIK